MPFKAKCISITTGVLFYKLTVGKLYTIYESDIHRGREFYQVYNDNGSCSYLPATLFEIV